MPRPRMSTLIVLTVLLTVACGAPNQQTDNSAPAATTTRTQPACSGRWLLHQAGYADKGAAPDRAQDPQRRFLYDIADSVWCPGVTPDTLINTARTLVLTFPNLCIRQPDQLPDEVLDLVDNGTMGGPIALAYQGFDLGTGRLAIYPRFVTASIEFGCAP
ncbi:hypothetical protein JK358_37255 [Nocardia sp. 2]|uniref:LppP/LprE lipoprotein n=1 Tax=Nocardia acididurans TaxID=2802282 RepID=A0ABS1MHC0_9NOCA|nr:hypothetical protein [Nocardia acididurans]MBL1080060.1 hypothetical protein [Nocardia acididurans]